MRKILLRFTLLFVVLGALQLSSCCTIVNGTTQNVRINTAPSAKIYVDGVYKGNSPQAVEVSRGQDHSLTIKAPGHNEYRHIMEGKISAWAWGNLLIGLVGLGIDVGTGSVYTFDDVNIDLEGQSDKKKS